MDSSISLSDSTDSLEMEEVSEVDDAPTTPSIASQPSTTSEPSTPEPPQRSSEEDYSPVPSAAKLAFLARLEALETDIDADLGPRVEERTRTFTKETLRVETAVDIALELLRSPLCIRMLEDWLNGNLDPGTNMICDFLTDEDGREMQKISVVRNLPDLVSAHPQETQDAIIPLLNETLVGNAGSLDLHCESALAYRKLLGNPEVRARHPGLPPRLFGAIAANLASPDTDNISGVAWIETLLEVVDDAPAESLRAEVLPIAVQQSRQAKSVQRRVAAIKLFQKLLPRLAPAEIRSSVVPCVQSLCQDPSPQVRNVTADRLLPPLIVPSAASRGASEDAVLPLLVELASDDDPGVQETALDVLALCLPGFPLKTLSDVIVPLVRKCAEKALQLDNSSLCVIAKNIGPWAYGLRDACSGEQRTWFLEYYRRLSRLGREGDVGAFPGDDFLDRFDAPDPVHAASREWAAHNFPGILVTYGVGNFESCSLQSLFAGFCTDPDEGVRRKIAQSFQVVAGLLEDYPADSGTKERLRNRVQESFISLIRGGDQDVVGELSKNFANLLPILYAGALEFDNGTPSLAIETLSGVKMNRMLLAFNRLIRNAPSWRCQEAFLSGLAGLRNVMPPRVLQQTFIPLLKEEVLTARALPCRNAAVRSLLLMARDCGVPEQLPTILEFFVETLCRHASCHKRSLFVDAARHCRDLVPPPLLKSIILPPLLHLLQDPVPNVRLKVGRQLGDLKRVLQLPEDAGLLSQMEAHLSLLFQSAPPLQQSNLQEMAMSLSSVDTLEPASVSSQASFAYDSAVSQSSITLRPRMAEAAAIMVTSIASSDSESSPPPVSTPDTSSSTRPLSNRAYPERDQEPDREHSPERTSEASIEVEMSRRSAVASASSRLVDPVVRSMLAPTIQIIDRIPPKKDDSRLPPNGGGLRLGKPRTAVVRPQPKILLSRSPSPRPDPKTKGDGVPPEKPSALKTITDRLTRSQEASAGTRRRVSTPQLRPVPKPGESSAPKTTTTIKRGVVGGSVRQMSSRWEPGDGNGNRKPLVLPIAGKPLERKSTSTYQAPATTLSRDRNNNPGPVGRSGIPQSETMLRRGSLQEEGKGGPNHLRPSASSSNLRSSTFGFGLMKVSSASAIHQKSSSILSMSTKSRRAES